MPTAEEVALVVWNIFSEPKPPQRKKFMEKVSSKQPDLHTNPIMNFSPFNLAHADRVKTITDKLLKSSTNHDELQKVTDALKEFHRLREKENPDLLYFALDVFLTHYVNDFQFIIPSILVRNPELVTPTALGINVEVAIGSAAETKLDWFREDPLLNEHHGHWHVVYNNRMPKDRQGEMFFYMHQQMLARYDAERIAEGVKRVIAFDNFFRPIDVGYAAGEDVRLSQINEFSARPAKVMVDSGDATEQGSHLQEIIRDIDEGFYDMKPAPDSLLAETRAMDFLGAVIEASSSGSIANKKYFNYHGNGHGYIGGLNNGVMLMTETAIRDVPFWEWHKGIDDLSYRLQQRFEAYNFAEDSPPLVSIRKSNINGAPHSMDIILCLAKDIPELNSLDFSGTRLAGAAFAGDNWDKDFTTGTFDFSLQGRRTSITTTDTLLTHMHSGTIRYQHEGRQVQYNYPYLNHDQFCYVIRLANTSLMQKQVTVRIFIAPATVADDRRMWIELDKFLVDLPPESRSAIFRRDSESSIIRKPAVRDPATHNTGFDPLSMPIDRRQCNCGWPYHMLLPRGQTSAKGMEFKLMIMTTDAEKDLMVQEPDCGSLSFCGTRNTAYPDKRPLGYPFNRKFPDRASAIINTITANKSMACRTVFIRHVGNINM